MQEFQESLEKKMKGKIKNKYKIGIERENTIIVLNIVIVFSLIYY